jgi:hypothetical protein
MNKEESLYYIALLLLVAINILFFTESEWAWDMVQYQPDRAMEPNADGVIPADIAKASFGYLAIASVLIFGGIAMFAQRTRVARFIYGISLFLIFVFFSVDMWYVFALDFVGISALFLYSYKESFIDSVRKR